MENLVSLLKKAWKGERQRGLWGVWINMQDPPLCTVLELKIIDKRKREKEKKLFSQTEPFPRLN